MSTDREKAIQERAYAIWQAHGQPHGRDEEHWAQASDDIARAETQAGSESTASKPDKSETRKTAGEPNAVGQASADDSAEPVKATKRAAARPKVAKASTGAKEGRTSGSAKAKAKPKPAKN